MKLKLLTGAYILVVAAIVVVADSRAWHGVLRPVREVPYGDKAGHFVLMGLLSLLVNLCLSCRSIRFAGVRVLAGSLIVLLVVVVEEFSQLFLRYRSFDAVDLVFDVAGIFLFGRLACLLLRARQRRAFSR